MKLYLLLLLPYSYAGAIPEFLNLLSGCFQVGYHYVEEGKQVYPAYHETSYEWITLKAEEKSYELRHHGIFEEMGEKVVVKHWGQSWTNVSEDTWTLSVLSPSDTPRYACTAEVRTSTLPGIKTFQRICDAKNTPKPRRDKDRVDYETLDRQHTWNITAKGWHDMQRNIKRDKAGIAVAKEVGWNEYIRVPEVNCKPAIESDSF